MTSLYEQLDVRGHEGDGHGNLGSIRQDVLLVHSGFLDVREDLERMEGRRTVSLYCDRAPQSGRDTYVIPSTAVETGRVVSELVDDLVHLVGGGKGLDELEEGQEVELISNSCPPAVESEESIKTYDSGSDGPRSKLDPRLGEVENVVPESKGWSIRAWSEAHFKRQDRERQTHLASR